MRVWPLIGKRTAIPPRPTGGLTIERRARALQWVAVLGWPCALTAVLLWPQRHRGYGLGHDMVFTPRQPLSSASFGLGSSSPRAVPLDALVSLASKVVDGAVVGRIALAFPLIAAGIAAATLIGRERLVGGLAASGFAVWNPFVVERLGLGQWALLWAYAALPWIIRYAARVRDERVGLAALALWLAAASITPTGGLIAAAVAVLVAWPRGAAGWRRRLAVPVTAAILQLPWVMPAIVGSAAATSDPAGVAAFAARSEHAGGPVLSLLGTGGTWDAEVVPSSRTGPLAFLGLAVVAATVVLGWPVLSGRLGSTTFRRVAICAGMGFVLAVSASTPGLSAVVRWAVRDVPGAGLLRDAQKWVLPYTMLVALLFGAAVARLAAIEVWRLAATGVALAVPLLLLPDAARTLRPTLDPVRYPADWTWARRAVGHDGDVAVLPFQSYRSFAWAPGRAVLDPAPRLLPGSVVVSDELSVSGRVLAGEDARARAVAAALDAGSDLPRRLARAGIGWVVVEHGTPGKVADLSGLRVVREGRYLSLYRVDRAATGPGPAVARIVVVLVGDGFAALIVLGAAASLLPRRRRSLVRSAR